jgi:hypothetical protein
LLDIENKSIPFITNLDSYWSDFDIVNPVKMSIKEEQNLFQKVRYNDAFWKTYQLPN